MAKIISISTQTPPYKHAQQELLHFMEGAYEAGEKEKRILNYLYLHSGIETRYSVIPDYSAPIEDWQFFPRTRNLEPFPGLGHRMRWFQDNAAGLSRQAAEKCINGVVEKNDISHLITVSCTGMSAPGLELQLLDAMQLNTNTTRAAINFMGCYAAIHGLKMANDIVNANPGAVVLVVCTELCSLHFQKTFADDSITAPLIFGDGSAAVLVCSDSHPNAGLHITSFYSEVLKDADKSMSWNISSDGFVMTLAPDVPDVLLRDINSLKNNALARAGLRRDDVGHWCIHPGGKRILQAIEKGLSLKPEDLASSYDILRNYGNMSSATILFVLQRMWPAISEHKGANVFAAAFGPGLTMESAILTVA